MTDQHGGPGWHPDPYHRYQYRYFNGSQWTADVSVDGRRYVDSLPLTSAGGPMYAQMATPRRGFAIAAMVLGIVSVVFAWMPFLFVAAGVGVILSIVFGIVGLRRARSQQGEGKGFAVAGLVLAAVSVALLPAGFAFTVAVIEQIDELGDPGPYEAQVTTCELREISTHVEAEITNLDDSTRDYDVTLVLRDEQGRIVDRTVVTVENVFAGDTEAFSANLMAEPGTCEITDVTGPLFIVTD